MEWALLKSAQEAQVALSLQEVKKTVAQELNRDVRLEKDTRVAMRASLEEEQLRIQKNHIEDLTKEKPKAGFVGTIKQVRMRPPMGSKDEQEEEEEEEKAPVVSTPPPVQVVPAPAPTPAPVPPTTLAPNTPDTQSTPSWHLVIRLKM